MPSMKTNRFRPLYLLPAAFFALAVVLFAGDRVIAQEEAPTEPAGSPMHPTFPLLDEEGANVLQSGGSVSTMRTCGACHDTAFIEQHSFHAGVGLGDLAPEGALAGQATVPGVRPWDLSPGLFGKWNPLTYRYLSPAGDERIDLTTAGWLQTIGARHVGGGPAVYSRDGRPLAELPPTPGDPETGIVDPQTGDLLPWDWQASGVVEMNCFLCHTPKPDNDARVAALQAGDFRWANTATLLNTGLVTRAGATWHWNEAAFTADGELSAGALPIQDPTNQNCGQCHGLVHVDAQTPLVMNACTPEQWETITTGQIVSPQRIANSGLNLTAKAELARSWDVHAERVLNCTDCHVALNNPVYYRDLDGDQPEHLTFDPRRIDIGEYLYRPLHNFAKGQSAQGTLAPELDGTIRRCESCHSVNATHDWLPYKERHTAVLSCETCHVPQMYAPARQTMDWTVLHADGSPQTACRGLESGGEQFGTALIGGFEPVLLPRQDGDGQTSLAPHNLITSWYWVYGQPERPVPRRDLQAAWLAEDGQYHPQILSAFDADADGRLDDAELLLDSREKEAIVASRLQALGLENVHIAGEVQPYRISHNVTHGEWATKACRTCHAETSRVTRPMLLADHVPGDVMPTLVGDSATSLPGELYQSAAGALYYRPQTAPGDGAALYLLGHDNVALVDWLGALLFLGTLAGAVVHGGVRYVTARRRAAHEPALHEIYMYSAYERLWHWLQTIVIFGLLFTGLIIHKPDTFAIFNFRYTVEVHNVLAAILLVNAALAAFYHLASGEIRQFLPRPHGFFDQAFTQARFYLRGIFRGEPHPFQKSRGRKLNPLQQITYFGLLNVLLPLQIITGALMWGTQRWPELAQALGGLPFLAPVHTLLAWLFASFIVMHVYLTTTGHTATANIRAMVVGWDEVELQKETA